MKVVFLSDSVFLEPNLSIVKRLSLKCDLTSIIQCRVDCSNKLGLTFLEKFITQSSQVEAFNCYNAFLPPFSTYVVKTFSNAAILKSLLVSFAVYKFIRAQKPDALILDSHNIAVFFAQFFLRKKSILIVHDPFLHSGHDKLSVKILRWLNFRLSKKKILLNESLKPSFINTYGCLEKDVYTSFLSEYEYMRTFPVLKSKRNRFSILFFGFISEYKGLSYLFAAVSELLDQACEIELVVAGSGDFSFDISRYQSYSNIKLINRYIDNSELAQLITDSSVVVCPYVDATQSGVIMTAYALAKPVIASSVGGLVEMVEHGVTGLIVPPKDITALKSAISTLQKNPHMLVSMSDNISQMYNAEKSWDVAVEKIWYAINN